jgi:hypothetical protein
VGFSNRNIKRISVVVVFGDPMLLVFVADDDPQAVNALTSLVQRSGFDVITVPGGADQTLFLLNNVAPENNTVGGAIDGTLRRLLAARLDVPIAIARRCRPEA